MRRFAILAVLIACAWTPAAVQAQAPDPATPELIDRALERGTIDAERADVLRVYALSADARLPEAYRSTTPWRGTLLARQIRRDRPAVRRAIAAAIPSDPNVTTCDTSAASVTSSVQTAHFYIQYTPGSFGASGLTVADYAASLEEAWNTEIDAFGWAAPPLDPDLSGKYHVILDPSIAFEGLYGFVSPDGTYTDPSSGDNPNTSWTETDAEASCMVLASDYSDFPGTPQRALDATTAHEFNHTLQYGLGTLAGANTPDDNFVEGGATWMEDEVQDAADDNYNYLYPQFDDSMGEYDEGDIYAYWLTFRGLTERFGTGTATGGQEVMRTFWERISRFTSERMLDSLNAALDAKQPGLTLADAYHDYAIAARLMAPCGGFIASPSCFSEADGYVDSAGPTEAQRAIPAAGGSTSGSIEDNYALNWVDLPTGAVYDVTLTKTSSPGVFDATVMCETATGFGFTSESLAASLTGATSATAEDFDARTCTRASLVISNVAQTSGNPSSSSPRGYIVSTSGAGSSPPPPTPTPRTPNAAVDRTGPILTLLSLSRRRFRAFRSGVGISIRRGTRVRYGLSEKATVRVRLQRRNSRGRWVTARGSAIDRGAKGANSFRFSGRWRRKRLAPGVYRLRLTPTDGARNAGVTRITRAVRIVS